MFKKVVVFDLDGTVFDCTHRLYLIEGDDKDFKEFHRQCSSDKPIRSIIELVLMCYEMGYAIVFCTGRPNWTRLLTEKSILEHIGLNPKDYSLLMRPTDNYKKDMEVKPKLFEEAGITPDKVWFIVEDRKGVVKKWRELGFTCLQCAEGDY